jgi:hypothetical protein
MAVWPKPAGPVWRTSLTGLGSLGTGSFEAEDTRRDRKACVEAKQGAVTGHSSDGENLKTSKTALEVLVSLVVRKGYFKLSVAST